MSDLLIDKQGAVTILTLNRPESLNALSPSLGTAFKEAVADFSEDLEQKVLIVTGAGEKAFCAGADLKQMKDSTGNADPAKRRKLPIPAKTDFTGLLACEKPTICALNGLAVGGGLEIALSCDIRLATEKVWFGTPEPARGFLAGVAVQLLPRLLPYGAVADMMLFDERMTAQNAYRLGLIQQITSSRDELMSEAMRRAEKMTKVSQSALYGTKQVIRYWHDMMLEEHHKYYTAVVHRVLLAGDMGEGLAAFAEKREPNFSKGWPHPFGA
ncbi:MAG TPA: enoyl-CoA hydratase/isomerase family protein [Novosphingobium sp.]|nr:enoyl-CoA hydratase/isomerase family protein [Novosphingobium sp.]